MQLLEEARFVTQTETGFHDAAGPWFASRVGFAIGERVFWTGGFHNGDPQWIAEAARDYAKAIVAAINEGRMFAEVQPAPPPPSTGVLPPGWMAWDVSKGVPSMYSDPFASFTQVMFKDGTKETCKAGFDWLADRGDNPIIAYFDEIPF